MPGEVEKCPILHVRPKFDVFTLAYSKGKSEFFTTVLMDLSPD